MRITAGGNAASTDHRAGRQISLLEGRLLSADEGEKAAIEQVAELRSTLSRTTEARRLLETDAVKQAEVCDRLSEANDKLSAKALIMADDGEQEKAAMRTKLEREIELLRVRLRGAEDDLDEARARSAC